MRHFILTLALIMAATCCPARTHKALKRQPVRLILDTDIGADYDDVGAMAVMHALADSGEVRILATVASNKDARVVPVIEAINAHYGRGDIAVGAPSGYFAPSITTWLHRTDWPGYISSHFAHSTDSTSLAPSAVDVYRKVLSKQKDGSVVVCSIGFFSNLKALLESGPDRWSKLSGEELVRRKVCLLVSMAGGFPRGYEFNVIKDAAAARAVAEHWPTRIIFSGFEIGKNIFTGNAVCDMPGDASSNPVKKAYQLALSEDDRTNGRESWDQTAVLVAIRGYLPWFGLRRGRLIIDEKGNNAWVGSADGPHAYLVAAVPYTRIAADIERLMTHQHR